MKQVISLGMEFDGSPLDKVMQILVSKDGIFSTHVCKEDQPEMYAVSLSRNTGAIVNRFDPGIMESDNGMVQMIPMVLVRMCLLKDGLALPENHLTFIRSIMDASEDHINILVSETPPEGFIHEYFMKMSDDVQYKMRKSIESGNIKVFH